MVQANDVFFVDFGEQKKFQNNINIIIICFLSVSYGVFLKKTSKNNVKKTTINDRINFFQRDCITHLDF